jgi:hypothetical protein
VTLGGILYHRGKIANYVNHETPISDWDPDVLLSYFCSNVDKDRSFDLLHEQTRVRVFKHPQEALPRRCE